MTYSGIGSCPKCGHGQNVHVGGTCYTCHTIDCMVILGEGNKWKMPAGWYTGKQLNEVASKIDPETRPFLMFLG